MKTEQLTEKTTLLSIGDEEAIAMRDSGAVAWADYPRCPFMLVTKVTRDGVEFTFEQPLEERPGSELVAALESEYIAKARANKGM